MPSQHCESVPEQLLNLLLGLGNCLQVIRPISLKYGVNGLTFSHRNPINTAQMPLWKARVQFKVAPSNDRRDGVRKVFHKFDHQGTYRLGNLHLSTEQKK